MGQCCSHQTAQTQYFDPQQLKLKQSYSNEKQQRVEEKVNEIKAEDEVKMEEVEIKLLQQQKEQEERLQTQEKILQIQKQKKEQFVDFHQIIHLYQKCIHHYKGHDVDSSTDVIKQIQALKETIKTTRQINQQQFHQRLKIAEQQWQKDNSDLQLHPYDAGFFKKVEQEMKDLLYYYHEVYKAPFIEKYNEDGVKISTRKQENTIGAMIETELHVPFEYFAAILTQVPYFTDFIPYCEKSTLIKDCGRNSKVGYIVLNFPMIARRQAYFQGNAYFRFKHHKDIFLFTRSIHDKPDLKKQFDVQTPLNEDYVTLDYKYFVINYQPLGDGIGRLKFAFNIDNGVHFLPEFIEDYITREFGKKFFNNIMKISRKFKGSKWEKSMIQNPDLSIFIKQKIKQQLDRLQQERQKQRQ